LVKKGGKRRQIRQHESEEGMRRIKQGPKSRTNNFGDSRQERIKNMVPLARPEKTKKKKLENMQLHVKQILPKEKKGIG